MIGNLSQAAGSALVLEHALIMLLLLGWQAHVPLAVPHVAGIGLDLVAAAVGVLMGRWLAPVPGEVVQSLPQALLQKEGKVFLLLLGTLLLWPQQEAVLAPGSLAVALLAALVAVLILRIVLYPLFDLMKIELRPPDASTAENGEIPR